MGSTPSAIFHQRRPAELSHQAAKLGVRSAISRIQIPNGFPKDYMQEAVKLEGAAPSERANRSCCCSGGISSTKSGVHD